MRKNLKSLSWALWLVIIAFVGFIFVEWGSGRLSPGGGKSEFLVVGSKTIKADKYRNFLLRSVENLKYQMKGKLNKNLLIQYGVAERTLQSLINSTIIKLEAEKYDLFISDEELSRSIINNPNFQRDGKFIGKQAYENVLRANRINIQEFEDNIRNDLLVDKLKSIVTAGIVVEEDQLWEMYRKEKDLADINYFTMDIESVKEKIKVNENEMKAYYDKNKNKYKTKEMRKGYVIALKFDDFKKDIKLDNKELYDYYKKNKKDFVDPEKIRVYRIFLKYNKDNRDSVLKRAEELKMKLNKDNFENNAKLISEDRKKDKGGDWGYTEWKTSFTQQELDLIDRLKEGDISNPISTLDGFSIIYMKEKKLKRQKNFDEVKDSIKGIMERNKLKKITSKKIEEIYNKIKDSKDIMAISKEYGYKTIETGYLRIGEMIKGVDTLGYISRKFFTMEKDNISKPFEMFDGYAIVQLKEIKEPEIMSYEKAKEIVKSDLENEKKVSILVKKANKILNEIKNKILNVDIEKILKDKYKLEYKNLSYRRGSRLGLFYKPELDNIVFSLNKDEFSKPIVFDNGVAIVKLNDKTITNKNDFKTEKEVFYNKIIKSERDNYFAIYILNKRQKYKIRINEKIYKEVKDYVLSRVN